MSGKATYPKKSVFEKMKSMYGENREIHGAFEKSLSAECSNGTFVCREKEGIHIFRGIPFAKPPVGSLRWKAPVPADDSEAVYEAYYFGKSPVQAPWFSEVASCYPCSEDCLYLNIWSSSEISKNKPVMVFIHGGAYGYGGTSDPLYDGFNFVKAHPEVILVTIAYRVGIMGFIDFTGVPGSEGYEDSCNLGLLDQIEALRWIRKNISSFGGDPENITVFGESAGGGSVSLLPIMPAAKGLFRRVIAQSGSVALTFDRTESKYFTELLLEQTGKSTMQELLSMTEEELYKANLPINEKNNFPVRDGRIVPEDPYECYRRGDSAWCDMIAGSNRDETRYWIGEMGGIGIYAAAIPVLFDNQCLKFRNEDGKKARQYFMKNKGRVWERVTEFENDIIFRVPAQTQLLLHSQNGGKAYHYFWTFPSALKNRGACHAVELSSVFNNPDEKIFTGDSVNTALASEVQQMWVNFAKTGNPSTENYSWPEYSDKSRISIRLGSEITLKENLFSRRTDLIKDLMKYYVNGNYSKLKVVGIPYSRILAGIAAAVAVIIICCVNFL